MRFIAGTMAAFMLSLSLIGFSGGIAAAQDMPTLNLPPGIAKQAQPLFQDMMTQMQDMGMTSDQMQMMMADMQTMGDQLPPGILLQILQLMPQLDMGEMMTLHQQMHQGGLLLQPPGQILRYVKDLAA